MSCRLFYQSFFDGHLSFHVFSFSFYFKKYSIEYIFTYMQIYLSLFLYEVMPRDKAPGDRCFFSSLRAVEIIGFIGNSKGNEDGGSVK